MQIKIILTFYKKDWLIYNLYLYLHFLQILYFFMLKFTELIQIPKNKQKDKIFWYPGFWWSSGITKNIFNILVDKNSTKEDQTKHLQKIVSSVLATLSIKDRYSFKKMIIDLIKDDFSYVDLLKRELRFKTDALEIKILEWKIKMMKEDIDMLEISTWVVEEYIVKKFRPVILPDNSLMFPLKNKKIFFSEKIILQKEFEWWDYWWLFSWINEIKQWDKNDIV